MARFFGNVQTIFTCGCAMEVTGLYRPCVFGFERFVPQVPRETKLTGKVPPVLRMPLRPGQDLEMGRKAAPIDPSTACIL